MNSGPAFTEIIQAWQNKIVKVWRQRKTSVGHLVVYIMGCALMWALLPVIIAHHLITKELFPLLKSTAKNNQVDAKLKEAKKRAKFALGINQPNELPPSGPASIKGKLTKREKGDDIRNWYFTQTNTEIICGNIHYLMLQCGYRQEQGEPGRGIYGTGIPILGTLFGTLARRHTFKISCDRLSEKETRLTIKKEADRWFFRGFIDLWRNKREFEKIASLVEQGIINASSQVNWSNFSAHKNSLPNEN